VEYWLGPFGKSGAGSRFHWDSIASPVLNFSGKVNFVGNYHRDAESQRNGQVKGFFQKINELNDDYSENFHRHLFHGINEIVKRDYSDSKKKKIDHDQCDKKAQHASSFRRVAFMSHFFEPSEWGEERVTPCSEEAGGATGCPFRPPETAFFSPRKPGIRGRKSSTGILGLFPFQTGAPGGGGGIKFRPCNGF
jgi:hypothetical protein